MVFGLFSRKSGSKAPAPSDHAPAQQLRTPSPSEAASVGQGPAPLGSPTAKGHGSPSRTHFDLPEIHGVPPDSDALTAHLKAVPAKTLHAYTLSHLPNADPSVLSALSLFYSSLTPPPRLHCVRCHKEYVEIENDDRSCLLPHDDESAVVERIGVNNMRKKGPGGTVREGATFETRWGCCDKTVEGDGDQGPPDGWCYEGRHTTDIRRARYRADSSPTEDKLISCLSRNCHGIRVQLAAGSASPMISARKRTRSTRSRKSVNLKETSSDDEPMETDEQDPTADDSIRGRARTARKESDDEDTRSVKSSRSAKEPKRPRRAASRAPASKARARSQGPPASRKARAGKKSVVLEANDAVEDSGAETTKEDATTESEKPKKKRRTVK
ncbi:hypothetical protein PUNSTDRAFT_142904 [Punctularia strigosozonata HHB-11173 SS5]|uniref:uncharacterized protein n=1 Tax=Punctularia strigosozonata (strain HHB-11173) TaxID=741275 RepID=UPI0004416A2E|nr:uncharacterized protein PUNSTDRAFT_142904 [Punctularia strigosozonata HHB-11173 SS5]EIN11044.1 hypothetical protein PUNSTDRAFT_142904 [Punctularia strigosozonata HHB-11173 SS5]